jgi:prophage antirepressor-like protein
VVPARSSRHGHLLARDNHAAVARKIHLSRLSSFPEPPLYELVCKCQTSEPNRFILDPIHQMPGLNT